MGGGIIGWAIRRPVTVVVGVILITIFGAVSLVGIPIQLTPDVSSPTITIKTSWPGATPSEIENEILEPQEEALKSISGLERMTGTATRDSGEVELELAIGIDLEEALVRVGNLLSQVERYPEAAREPVISTDNSRGPPLAVLVIQSDPPGRPVAEYRTFIEENIVSRFERIRGVASIVVRAGQSEVVYVDFDPTALAARGLSLSQVSAAIRAELSDVSAGDIPSGKRRYLVRTLLAPVAAEELERTVLSTADDGTPILLGDVATVRPGLRKADAVGIVDGEPAMALLFYREAGSNVLEVTEQIRALTEVLQRERLDREGLRLRIVSDQTGYITGALDLVRSNLLMGGALAIVVLLLFLRSVGASAVVAVSIPISIVGTVLLMSLMGRTINIVSLAGMAFAVGMVVDNSIVVLENIDSWRRRESNPAEAALRGTGEVWGAIFASTLTTAAVFLPIIAWKDEIGELVRDVAVAVAVAVFVSLVVSVLVIPSIAAKVLRNPPRSSNGDERYARVHRAVSWVVGSPLRALLVATVGIGITTGVGLRLIPSLEYLPSGNRNLVFGVLISPPGYSVEEVDRIGHELMDQIVPHLHRDQDGVPAFERSFFVGSPDQTLIGATADDPLRVAGVQGFLRQILADVPDMIGFANQASLFGQGLGGTRAIEVDILGSDLTSMVRSGQILFGAIREALPGSQIRPVPSLDVGAAELQVEPNRAEAARYGLSSSDVGVLIDAYIDGAIIGELGSRGNPKRDVILRARGVPITDPAALLSAPLATPSGQVVPVSRVARVKDGVGPDVIQRIERRRAITLEVVPPESIALEDAISTIRTQVVPSLRDKGAIPPDIDLEYAGSAGKLELAKERFGLVLLFAVIITFLLLAALFEDFLAPLAILVTVPLAGTGGVVALALVDRFLGAQPLDMLTALGFVILIGVVVNNAILIVDGALGRMREQSMELGSATAEAVRRRVRPILMSATTSLAGLLPLVLFPGSGSELYRGVGAIVLGGLALSTVLSLFLVPAVFTSLWRLRAAVAGLRPGAR